MSKTTIHLSAEFPRNTFTAEGAAEALDLLAQAETLARQATGDASAAARFQMAAFEKAAESEKLRGQAFAILVPTQLPASYFPETRQD